MQSDVIVLQSASAGDGAEGGEGGGGADGGWQWLNATHCPQLVGALAHAASGCVRQYAYVMQVVVHSIGVTSQGAGGGDGPGGDGNGTGGGGEGAGGGGEGAGSGGDIDGNGIRGE